MNSPETDRLAQLAGVSVALAPCPRPEQLAAYMLNTLTPPEQLSVDAHVRRCPLCASDIALARPDDLRAEWPIAARPAPRRSIMARLAPAPLTMGVLRGEAATPPRRYESAALTMELVIDQRGDFCRLTGQVLRDTAGVAGCTIVLRVARRRYTQSSDDAGFFTFEDLPPGRYRLLADDGRVRVEIADLELGITPG
jgi:hypothetical protein